MDLSAALSRWVAAKAVAVLVTVGVVLVGVSAWGADSAQAYKDVQLTVVNKAKASVGLELCSEAEWTGSGLQDCPFDDQLGQNQKVSDTSADVSGIMDTSIAGPGWSNSYRCLFSAHNPAIGEPYFYVYNDSDRPGSENRSKQYALSEGQEEGPILCDYFEVVLLRKDDTSDAKVMQITITKAPNESANAKLSAGSFRSVSAGGFHTCGVRPNDTVACWGEDSSGQTTTTPSLRLKSVSAGLNHTCGVRPDDTVVCWGKDDNGEARPPAGTFKSVSAGGAHTCGVRTDDTVACWGNDNDGQARPPAGTFKAVSAGGFHTCGLRTNDTVACWGYNLRGQARPPRGTFKSVSAGGYFTCGVRTDDTVACWGNDSNGQARPPADTFKSVSAGYTHTCGVRSDDTVACWGRDDFGQARPPAGTFKSVSAGFQHSCGVRTNDTVACWGDDTFGQS